MYIHIGGDESVRTRDVIGIFDLDRTTVSKRTRDFLAAAEKAGRTSGTGPDLPRSFVLSDPGGVPRVTLSHVSVQTLAKRFENGQNGQ